MRSSTNSVFKRFRAGITTAWLSIMRASEWQPPGFRALQDGSIQDDILQQMARQIGVSTLSFFKGMITCSKSLDDYVQHLRERNIL
jgi:hypothetical protein